MIGHDFRQGLVKRLWWLLLPASLFLVVMLMGRSTFAAFELEPGLEPSLGAYLFYVFAGCLPVDAAGKDFFIALEWMLVQIGCLVFTAEYPSRDLESPYGMQVLVRGGSRRRWWYAKCLWNMASVCLYYGVLYLTALLYCLCTGAACTFSLEESVVMRLLEIMSMARPAFSGSEIAPILLGMPTLVMAGVCLWQMVIAILWHPVYGFAAGIVLLIWSSFAQTPLAIGNYAMMQRCDLFYQEGLSFPSGCWAVLAYILMAIVIGGLVMKRRDILKPMKLGS
ncbi:MAG: hypothetical protein ACI3XJ_02400 [Oscillospiraceae bacterium]